MPPEPESSDRADQLQGWLRLQLQSDENQHSCTVQHKLCQRKRENEEDKSDNIAVSSDGIPRFAQLFTKTVKEIYSRSQSSQP